MTLKTKHTAIARKMFLLTKATKHSSPIASIRSEIVSSVADLRKSLPHATKDSLWISYERQLTEALLRNISWPTSSLGNAVLIHSMATQTLPTLASCFKRFVFATKNGFLPVDELVETLAAENKADLVIGGTVDDVSKTITLWRGNLEPLTVPFRAFDKSGDGIMPDFAKFAITDHGQTIRLGNYEAASDAILYEFDREYRHRKTKERQRSELSFGASLRRLRKQRGLRREDFTPDVASKTIARIEQGRVNRIQKKTLKALAKHLKVNPEEISSY